MPETWVLAPRCLQVASSVVVVGRSLSFRILSFPIQVTFKALHRLGLFLIHATCPLWVSWGFVPMSPCARSQVDGAAAVSTAADRYGRRKKCSEGPLRDIGHVLSQFIGWT